MVVHLEWGDKRRARPGGRVRQRTRPVGAVAQRDGDSGCLPRQCARQRGAVRDQGLGGARGLEGADEGEGLGGSPLLSPQGGRDGREGRGGIALPHCASWGAGGGGGRQARPNPLGGVRVVQLQVARLEQLAVDRGGQIAAPEHLEIPRQQRYLGSVEVPEDDVGRLEAAHGIHVLVHRGGVITLAVEVLSVPTVQRRDVLGTVGGVGIRGRHRGAEQILTDEEGDLVGGDLLGQCDEGSTRRKDNGGGASSPYRTVGGGEGEGGASRGPEGAMSRAEKDVEGDELVGGVVDVHGVPSRF
mmetsp:Transcript_20799/g.60532  ORF Transcript_20799/g.60532 Transcript_20799/m.60532 type:complete len:300 (-) Transcript_20799:1904-2803(-)